MSVIPNEDLQEAFRRLARRLSARRAPSSAARPSARSSTASARRCNGCLRTSPGTRSCSALGGCTNRAILSSAVAGPGTFFGRLEQSPASISMVDYFFASRSCAPST